MSVRVRFAPSPTGMLHVGGVRTAIYNWLFARRHGGSFLLRIDDTDVERNRDEAVKVILEGLRWVGIPWDEGPIYQSQRLDRYREAGERLVKAGRAYRARDSEGLRRWRETREARGLKSAASVEDRAEEGEALYFRVFEGEPGDSAFEDLVKGKMGKAAIDVLPEFVILRAGGIPTYNFATVVDDIELRITHVIRGDDHVENTHKHIALFRALGAAPPAFAHLPMIHNDRGEKLSKRRDPVAVTEFEGRGILPEALANFLALLGWSPGSDVELMPLAEMANVFDLGRVRSSAARFDLKKLHWMNGQYIKGLPAADFARRLRAYLDPRGIRLLPDLEARFAAISALFQARISTLAEFRDQARMFVEETPAPDEKAARVLGGPGVASLLAGAAGRIGAAASLDAAVLEPALRALADERGLPFKDLAQAIRAAVTGGTVSPPLFEMLALLGKERTVARIRRVAGTPA